MQKTPGIRSGAMVFSVDFKYVVEFQVEKSIEHEWSNGYGLFFFFPVDAE